MRPAGDLTPSGSPLSNRHALRLVWSEPRRTILDIHAADPGRLYPPLAAAWGASYNLTLTLRRGIPAEYLANMAFNSVWAVIGINVFFGAVFGVVVLWALSFLIAWLGRLVGGRGGARDVRTVLAWSSVPQIPNLMVAALVLAIGGTPMLTAARPTSWSVSGPLEVLFILGSGTFGIWSFVISVAGLSAVMGISEGRAVGVFVLGTLSAFVMLLSSIVAFVRLAGG